jgi:mono/diheme cytochrome c family protein
MLSGRMGRRPLIALLLAAAAAVAAACGQGIELDDGESAQVREGAELFHQRCSGCHTLDAIGAEGSADNVNSREYKDGPNFNTRVEEKDQILYAIRNGGFSSGPMPQNIVVGAEAEAVAEFLAKYAGRDIAEAQ